MTKVLASIFIGLVLYYVGYFLWKTYQNTQEKKKKEESEQTYQTFIDEDLVQEQEKKK